MACFSKQGLIDIDVIMNLVILSSPFRDEITTHDDTIIENGAYR